MKYFYKFSVTSKKLGIYAPGFFVVWHRVSCYWPVNFVQYGYTSNWVVFEANKEGQL